MKCARKRRAGFTCPYSDCRGAWNAPEKKLAGFTCPYIGEVGSQQCFSARGENKKIGGGGGN